MAVSKTAAKTARRSGNGAGVRASQTFTDAERAAMKERAREQRAQARRGAKGDGEGDLLAKIAEMGDGDRVMAEQLHALVMATAPALSSRTWYGMPAYANDGNVVCYFKPAEKFKTRYATLGFSDKAQLDDGAMWPTEYAVHAWTPDVASRIEALVRTAVS